VDFKTLLADVGLELDHPLVLESLTRTAWILERNAPVRDFSYLHVLGEAAMFLIVTETLTRLNPRGRPGELKGIRQDLLSKAEVLKVGLELGVGDYLRAGKGERAQRIQTSEKVAEHVVALIGAVYKAAGPGGAEVVVHQLYHRRWPRGGGGPLDSKTEIERLYSDKGGVRFTLVGDVGTPEVSAMLVQAELPDGRVYTGTGRTTTIAAIHAARAGLVG
jgi:ribonuclease-3